MVHSSQAETVSDSQKEKKEKNLHDGECKAASKPKKPIILRLPKIHFFNATFNVLWLLCIKVRLLRYIQGIVCICLYYFIWKISLIDKEGELPNYVHLVYAMYLTASPVLLQGSGITITNAANIVLITRQLYLVL